MTETYQPIYDAVRSRISGGNIGEAIADVARQAFDISWTMETLKQEFCFSAYEHRRPSVLFRPTLSADGDQWCALYGDNLQVGVAGFGETPEKAMIAFDIAWLNDLTPCVVRALKEPTP